MALNSSLYFGSPAAARWEVLISLSVMPPSADTTTMTGSSTFSTIFFRLSILSGEPTEVPPNFSTLISISFVNETTPYHAVSRGKITY